MGVSARIPSVVVATCLALASLVSCGAQLHAEASVHLGAPYLVVHRHTSGLPEVLPNPTQAEAEDLLQLAYVASGRRFGVIVSIDGRSQVTLHAPETPAASTELVPTGMVSLSRAFELDDAPNFERFFFVTAAEPIDVERVLQAGYELGRDQSAREPGLLALDPAWEQGTFTLYKVPRADAEESLP